MRLNKPIGIYLLMWPMLWAFLVSANGQPNIFYLLLFMIGAVLTRSAGCVINDYFDRDIDSKVERTKERMLVSGKVSSNEATIIFIALLRYSFRIVTIAKAYQSLPAPTPKEM